MSAEVRNWLQAPVRRDSLARVERPREEAVPGGAEDQTEDVDSSKAYGGLWSRRDNAHTIEFRFLDADKADETVDYAWLPRVQWRKGQGIIILHYEALGVKVSISGINLSELKERIRQHLVTWVREQGSDPLILRQARDEAKAEGKDFVFVERILFEEEEGASDQFEG